VTYTCTRSLWKQVPSDLWLQTPIALLGAKKKKIRRRLLVSRSACGLLANNENYGVPSASQQYFFLTVNQYQPPTIASRIEENFKLNIRI